MSAAKTAQNDSGFTLVELLVTIVVLGIAVVGLGSLYNGVQNAAARSQRLDIAVRAARTEIENLRNNGYNTLVAGSVMDFTAELPTVLPPDRHGTVTVSEPMADLKRVDVTITYTDLGKPQTVTLSSNIGVIGIGQGQ